MQTRSERRATIPLMLIMLLTAIVILLLGILIPMALASNYTSIRYIDRSFDGLSHSVREDGKTVRLLVIHGIGRHCVGYSDDLVGGIVRNAGFSGPPSFERVLGTLAEELERERRERETPPNPLEGDYPFVGRDCGLVPILGLRDCEDAGKTSSEPDESERLDSFVCGRHALERAKDHTCASLNRNVIVGETRVDVSCQRIALDFQYNRVMNGELLSEVGPATLGYVKTRAYHRDGDAGGRPALVVYELTWDPATRRLKEEYLYPDRDYEAAREPLNHYLKANIVNESLADAVMYLGKYERIIQYPVLSAYCKMLMPLEEAGPSSEFRCNPERVAEQVDVEEFLRENEVAIITHSLGTRLAFDTLGLLGADEFLPTVLADLKQAGAVIPAAYETARGEDAARKIRDVFVAATNKVFNLANQVPLLELSILVNPFHQVDDSMPRDLGDKFRRFLDKRAVEGKEALQVVTFTDPNDLLSYNMKCWYHRNVVRLEHKDRIADDIFGYAKERAALQDLSESSVGTAPETALSTLFRQIYGRVFQCGRDEQRGELADLYDKTWKHAQDYIDLAEVSMSLSGLRYPNLAADPKAAHSRYFDDETLYRLIACGGTAGGKTPGECAAL